MTFVKCLQCNKILESKHTHDFVRCSCPNQTFLDGGDDYCRYGGKEKDMIQIIDSTTIHSFIKDNYPTYDGDVDSRSISEILDEIHQKLNKYT